MKVANTSEQSTQRIYQGISVYLDQPKSGKDSVLCVRWWLSSEREDYMSATKKGFLPVSENDMSIEKKIIKSRWLDEPVDKTGISKISNELYDSTMKELVSRYPPKKMDIPEIKIKF